MAQFIRHLGWRARALPHGNAPYLHVPVFVDAGIGEQGRYGIVITKEFGGRFRAAAVATDMPLALDRPVDFGLQDFCEKCKICAKSCPGGAITFEGREVVRGVRRWNVNRDKCRRIWEMRDMGCGICEAVCPWNHPNIWLHDTVRDLNEIFPSLRKFFIRCERVIHGRFKPVPPPDWMKNKGTRDK